MRRESNWREQGHFHPGPVGGNCTDRPPIARHVRAKLFGGPRHVAMEQDRRKCMDAGMNDFLVKPIDPAEMTAILLRWARPRRFAGGRVYLDAGAQEPARTLRDARRLRDLLAAKGYVPGTTLAYVEDPDGAHDEASWARRFRAASS